MRIGRLFSIMVITLTILMTGIILNGPARGDRIADNNPMLVSSTRIFEGLLTVKEADGVFLVRSESGEKKRFTCNPSTSITRNEKPATYRDLRSRDHLRVYYDTNFVVTTIQATGS